MRPPREIDDDAPVPAKLRFAIAHKRLLGLEFSVKLTRCFRLAIQICLDAYRMQVRPSGKV